MAIGGLIVGVGSLILAAAYFEWNWFVNHRKTVRLTKLIGWRAVRVTYFVFGGFSILTGLLMMAGLIDPR